jgi:hypothetical protein
MSGTGGKRSFVPIAIRIAYHPANVEGRPMSRAALALKAFLNGILREHGFRARGQSDFSFRRKEKHGFSELWFSSYAVRVTGGHQVIGLGLGVRHDRVDNVVNRLGHIWGEHNQKNTTTVSRGMEFFPFDERRDGDKIIRFEHIEEDAYKASCDISDMLLRDGFDFFDRHSTVEECSHGLNEPIRATVHPLCNNYPLRAYYGVTAAALSEPDRVPNLIAEHAAYASAPKVVDNGVYDVAKDLRGADAVSARLRFVAELALQS